MPPKKPTKAKSTLATTPRVGTRKRNASQEAVAQEAFSRLDSSELEAEQSISATSSVTGSNKKAKVVHPAYNKSEYQNGNFAGFVNPAARRKRSQKMKWTPENDVKLMLFGLGKEIKPCEYPAIARSFPENPTAKAVQERLTKLRKNQMVMLEEMGIIPQGGYNPDDDCSAEEEEEEEEEEKEEEEGEEEVESSDVANLPPLYPQLAQPAPQTLPPLYGHYAGHYGESKHMVYTPIPDFNEPEMMRYQQNARNHPNAMHRSISDTYPPNIMPHSTMMLPAPVYQPQRPESRGITEPIYANPCGRESTKLPGMSSLTSPNWPPVDNTARLSPFAGYSGAGAPYTTVAEVGSPHYPSSMHHGGQYQTSYHHAAQYDTAQQQIAQDRAAQRQSVSMPNEFDGGTARFNTYADSLRTIQPQTLTSEMDKPISDPETLLKERTTRQQPSHMPRNQQEAGESGGSDADAEADDFSESENAARTLKNMRHK